MHYFTGCLCRRPAHADSHPDREIRAGEHAMNVADAIVKVLRDEGIRHVFCVPGAAIDPLLEALSRQHDVEAVVCAHEAGAAFAADGYSRASGRFGVYATTSGPGFTNTM